MKNKISYKIWKVKNNKIYQILFRVKKILFKTENGIKENGNKTINMIKEMIISLFYIFVISILLRDFYFVLFLFFVCFVF